MRSGISLKSSVFFVTKVRSYSKAVAAMTRSFGPYKLAEYSRGESIRLEAYEDYVPVAGVAEMQKANIKELLYVWRVEDLVRAAVVRAGEADWAWNIGVENMNQVPVAKVEVLWSRCPGTLTPSGIPC
jgi:ABC-type transport system substrate-binding protein